MKDAKIVRQSRNAKRAYEGRGTGRGGPPEPNILANVESLIKQSPTLAVEEAANFAVPLVTWEAGLFCAVEVRVSRVFAVTYVPP